MKRFCKWLGLISLTVLLSINSLGFSVLAQQIDKEGIYTGAFGPESEELEKIPIDEINQMDYDEVIDYFLWLDQFRNDPDKAVTDEYLSIVAEYSEGKDEVYDFYNDKDRFQSIIDAISERAAIYTDTDTKGLYTLIEIVRLGYYVGFYNQEVGYLNSKESRELPIPAIRAIQNNPNFKLGTEEQDILVTSTGLLIHVSLCTADTVNGFNHILKDYYDNRDIYIGNNKHKQKELAVYQIMMGVKRAADDIGWLTELNGNIDEFIDYVGKFALMGNYHGDNAALINNGIWVVQLLSPFHSDISSCHRVLTDALNIYERLSEPYLQAVDAITYGFNGYDADGNYVDKPGLQQELKELLLPMKYSFDNGKFVVIAGDRVTEEKIQRLYWASKEVRAQLFRMYGRDQALETGHADDVMTAVIYNDMYEYNNNLFINGYVTDNGGIYIEAEGTFYTWERTPEESRYTLEELFRHEFTHYLQGRYVTPGYWGEGIYEKNRMTWFEEGGAELLAGSTRTEGILPRRSVITTNSSFAADPEDRFSIDKLLGFNQYTGELYAYAYALRSFLNDEQYDMFATMADLIKDYDIEGYDEYLNNMRSDEALNEEYQAYMEKLYEDKEQYTIPLVDDIYVQAHENTDSQEVYSNITAVANLKDIKVEELRSQFVNTFTLSGVYTGGKSLGEEEDMHNMSEIADGFLKTLNTYNWSGYKTLTCYFTDHDVDINGNVQYKVVFHGLLTKELENKLPTAKMDEIKGGVTGQNIGFRSTGSVDPDGVLSYLWDFGDGSTSTIENPNHIYTERGEYTVSLTVEDLDGEIDSVSTVVIIEDYLVYETESNNRLEYADGPIYENKIVTAKLDSYDIKDFYYFDVVRAGEIVIEATTDSADGIYWNLYDEPNLDSKVLSTSLPSLSYVAEPGRYYLGIYNKEENDITYDINITGTIKDDSNSKVTSIEEVDDVVINYNQPTNILPETVKTNMSDGSTENLRINWDMEIDTTIPGEYEVTGTVDGIDTVIEINATVMPYVFSETEPNNSFDDATGPVVEGRDVAGVIDLADGLDYYYFDVDGDKELRVSVATEHTDKMNWLICHEEDLDNWVVGAKKFPGELANTFNAKPGRYYFVLYSFVEGLYPYTLTITSDEMVSIIELENLSDEEVKFGSDYTLPSTIKATMSDGSTQSVEVEWNEDLDTSKPGTYIFIGSVEGTELTTTLKITVKELGIDETEPNDEFDMANGIYSNDISSGSLVEEDEKDIYFFNVDKTGEISITVNSKNYEDMNWLLRSATNTEENITYAEQVDGKLTNSIELEPGKYYIIIYKFTEDDCYYSLNIDGDIMTSQPVNLEEEEPNNIESEANAIFDGDTLVGVLSQGDKKDIYYFDVKSEEEISITVKTDQADMMNWVVYNESDPNTYVAYAEKVDSELKNSFSIMPGRYYLTIYKFTDIEVPYTLNIKGDIGERN